MNTPKIYVADLTAYNEGILHGTWIDASDKDTMLAEIAAMLQKSPIRRSVAEEWAIHDFEGFCGLDPSDFKFDSLGTLADMLGLYGEAFAVFVGLMGIDYCDIEEFKEKFENCYLGEFGSTEEYAEQFLDDTGMLDELPEWAKNYFDFKSYASDLKYSGEIFSERSSTSWKYHFFRNE